MNVFRNQEKSNNDFVVEDLVKTRKQWTKICKFK